MSESRKEARDVDLRVLYDFEYQTKDDRKISITEGEKLFLIKKTNPDWWQVIRSSKERPFFVPAKYVEESSLGESNGFEVNIIEDNGNEFNSNESDRDDINKPSGKEPNNNKGSASDLDGVAGADDRILRDRRKSWAVEELLLELTRSRGLQPEPEPEPDYDAVENSFDADGNLLKSEGTTASPEPCNTDNVVLRSKHSLSKKQDKIASEPMSSIESSQSDKEPESGAGSDIREVLRASCEDSVSLRPSAQSEKTAGYVRVSVHLPCVGGPRVSVNGSLAEPAALAASAVTPSNSPGIQDSVVRPFEASSPNRDDSVKPVQIVNSKVEEGVEPVLIINPNPEASVKLVKPAEVRNPRVEENVKSVQIGNHNPKASVKSIESSERNLESSVKPVQTNDPNIEVRVKRVESTNRVSDSRADGTVEDVKPRAEPRTTAPRSRVSVHLPPLTSDPPGVAKSDRPAEVSYARVAHSPEFFKPEVPKPARKGPKVTQLSESLERLAQQITFGPAAVTTPPPLDESIRDEMFLNVKERLTHSRSFKSKKELDKLRRHPTAETSASPIPEQAPPLAALRGNHVALSFQNPGFRRSADNLAPGPLDVLNPLEIPIIIEKPRLVDVPSKAEKPGPPTVAPVVIETTKPSRWEAVKAVKGGKGEGDWLEAKRGRGEGEGSRSSLDELVSSFEELARSRSGSNTSDDTTLDGRSRRKASLTRGNRVDSQRPPTPPLSQRALRCHDEGWAEFTAPDGRAFFFRRADGARSWKPPRRARLSDSEEAAEPLPVPAGWTETVDEESGQPCFVHPSGEKWFSSSDAEGRVYFFEENSASSHWSLPPLAPPSPPVKPRPRPSIANIAGKLMADRRRFTKTMSMVVTTDTYSEEKSPPASPTTWPHLFGNNTMKVIREGVLQRARVLEQGRKVRKAWGPAYVVLTELFLLFFPEQKHAQALVAGGGVMPELCVELSGARVAAADRAASSRKHALSITSQLGRRVLLQADSAPLAAHWLHDITTAIGLLPQNENAPMIVSSPEQSKKSAKVQRSKSMKLKGVREGSVEDLTASPEERQTKIRARLRKFFIRRPTREALVKKGIYKDEPMFGRLLSDVIAAGQPAPAFVCRCVELIESRDENMKADGLYRVSGNLSQVQRIRLAADQNDLSPLESEEDVHVITGALKLFFRELKQPLIPCQLFARALAATSLPGKTERLQKFRDIVRALPSPNRSTLRYLLTHLLKVSALHEFNRMHVANVAMVFGPTLMWPAEDSTGPGSMATDLMQQNMVVESLLLGFEHVFH